MFPFDNVIMTDKTALIFHKHFNVVWYRLGEALKMTSDISPKFESSITARGMSAAGRVAQ